MKHLTLILLLGTCALVTADKAFTRSNLPKLSELKLTEEEKEVIVDAVVHPEDEEIQPTKPTKEKSTSWLGKVKNFLKKVGAQIMVNGQLLYVADVKLTNADRAAALKMKILKDNATDAVFEKVNISTPLTNPAFEKFKETGKTTPIPLELANVATKEGEEIWGRIKNTFKGFAPWVVPRKAAEELYRGLFTAGVDLALEAITPMVRELSVNQTDDTACQCFNANTTCTCRGQIPGFKKASAEVQFRLPSTVSITLKYGGWVLAKTELTDKGGKDACELVPGTRNLLAACIVPDTLTSSRTRITPQVRVQSPVTKGCFQIKVQDPTERLVQLAWTRCITHKQGRVTITPFN